MEGNNSEYTTQSTLSKKLLYGGLLLLICGTAGGIYFYLSTQSNKEVVTGTQKSGKNVQMSIDGVDKKTFDANFKLLESSNYLAAEAKFEKLKGEAKTQEAKNLIDMQIAAAAYAAANPEKAAKIYLAIINDASTNPTQKEATISEVLDYYYVSANDVFLKQYIFPQQPFNAFLKQAQRDLGQTGDIVYSQELLDLTLQKSLEYAASLGSNSFVQTRLARAYLVNSQKTVDLGAKAKWLQRARDMQIKAESTIAATAASYYVAFRPTALITLNGVTRYLLTDYDQAEILFKQAIDSASTTRLTGKFAYDSELIARYQYAIMLSDSTKYTPQKQKEIEVILKPFVDIPDVYNSVTWDVYYIIKRAAVLTATNAKKHSDLQRLAKVSPLFRTILTKENIVIK